MSQTVFVPLDESGEPITVCWDSDAGERCLVTRDEKDHFATWRIVDKDGAELRRGTWRTETTGNAGEV